MHNRTIACGDTGLLHQELNLGDLGLLGIALHEAIHAGVPAANDFLAARFAAGFIVHNAIARHVNAHVGRRLVGAAAVDALKHGREHGENLHVTVVVDGRHAVGLQMEGVYHVDIV